MLLSIWCEADLPHEFVFSLMKTLSQCLLWIPWEALFSYYEMMKIVSQVFSACMATMTVIHSEEWAFGPVFMLAMLWFHYVQDDRNSILIVSSDQALVGVCRISPYYPVPPQTAFCRLMIWHHYPRARLQRQLTSVLIIAFNSCVFMKHQINIQSRERLDLGRDPCLRVNLLRYVNVILVLFKEGLKIQFTTIAHSGNAWCTSTKKVLILYILRLWLEFVMRDPMTTWVPATDTWRHSSQGTTCCSFGSWCRFNTVLICSLLIAAAWFLSISWRLHLRYLSTLIGRWLPTLISTFSEQLVQSGWLMCLWLQLLRTWCARCSTVWCAVRGLRLCSFQELLLLLLLLLLLMQLFLSTALRSTDCFALGLLSGAWLSWLGCPTTRRGRFGVMS